MALERPFGHQMLLTVEGLLGWYFYTNLSFSEFLDSVNSTYVITINIQPNLCSRPPLTNLKKKNFGVPLLATFILLLLIGYVIDSIAYIHPVYGRIRTHYLLDVSLLPQPLDQASRLKPLTNCHQRLAWTPPN
jgi:hypothetical protein